MLNLEAWKQKFAEKFPEKSPVFGEGQMDRPVVLVGEAPGGEEEAAGRPFVGKAGKNLNGFLEALSLPREQLYVTNVVKIRPTKVNPTKHWMSVCLENSANRSASLTNSK